MAAVPTSYLHLCMVSMIVTASSGEHGNSSSTFIVVDNKLHAFESARTKCKTFGKAWDLPSYQRLPNQLELFLNKSKLSSIWLSLRKTNYGTWTWINEMPADPLTIFDDQVPQSKCGGVSLQERNLRSMDCAEWRNGFVCEMSDSAVCPEKYLTQSCVKFSGKWYMIGCRTENWQSARAYCRNRKGDLAILDNEDKLNAVFDYIISGKLADKCSWLYAGIRKEDWRSAPNETAPLTVVNWARGEPRHDSSCVQITFTGDHYQWKSTPCSTPLKVVCQNYASSLDESWPEQPKQENKPRKFHMIALLFGIVLFSGAVILFSAALTIFLHSRRRLCHHETQMEGDEAVHLVSHSKLDKLLNSKRDQDYITIVMFSPWVDPHLPTFAKCLNTSEEQKHNPDNTGSHAARIMCDEFKELANSGSIQFEEKKKYLEIVNIVTSSSDAQLGPHEAKPILQELVNNADFIDIVYLPGIGIPVESEILELLKDLREKCCVLCLGKHNVTEIPASEVICIGLKMGAEDLIGTGILDIRVRVTEEGSSGINTNDGVARMVGFIAGLLQYAKQNKGQPVYRNFKSTQKIRKLLIETESISKQKDETGFGTLTFDQQTRQDTLQMINKWVSAKKDEAGEDKQLIKPLGEKISTYESIKQAIQSIKKYTGEQISIVVAAAPISNANKFENWLSIIANKTGDDAGDETGDLGDCFIRRIHDTFSSMFVENTHTHEPMITIHSVPIRSNDRSYSSEWRQYHTALSTIRQIKPHIVYISSDSKSPPAGTGVKRTLAQLVGESIVVTGAKELNGPVAPSAFPAESVLTVSRRDGQQGSLIDFISDSPQAGDVCPKEAWVAAADTVCTATAVLMRARQICEDNLCNNLKKTVVMRNILLNMCSDYPNHSVAKGFGVLRPSLVLNDDKLFKGLVEKYGGTTPPTNYWSGKEIT